LLNWKPKVKQQGVSFRNSRERHDRQNSHTDLHDRIWVQQLSLAGYVL